MSARYPASMRRIRFSLRLILSAEGIGSPRARTRGPPSRQGALPGDHDVEDAIGERVLQGVAVRVRREVDLREVRPVPFPLERGPRRLEPRLPRPRREAVDERLSEHAELPFERVLEHAVNRTARLFELVLDAHGGIPLLPLGPPSDSRSLSLNPKEIMRC